MSTNRLPNWYSHFERPDESYPDYNKVFGDDLDLIDYDIDDVVDEYYRMGPPDEDYMREVRARWSR